MGDLDKVIYAVTIAMVVGVITMFALFKLGQAL